MRSPTTSGTSQLQALPHPQEAQTLASPPTESFAYRPNAAASPKPSAASSAVVNLSDVDDFDWDLNDAAPAANKVDDDWNISDEDEEVAVEDLEDDFDEEEEHPVVTERALPPRSTRGHRVIIDEDSYLEDEGFGVEDDDDDEEEEFGVVEKKGNGRGEEPDVLGKALLMCAKISAELKELYGSSSVLTERYAVVETSSSSARIVTQEDVDAACSSEVSDFEPMLKPYQLVGVNFL